MESFVIVGPFLRGLYYGAVLGVTMMGFATVQIYHYYETYPNDAPLVRLFVAFCAAIVFVAGLLDSSALYQCVVPGQGTSPSLSQSLITPENALFASLLMTAFPCCLIQVFFAWRVGRLTGRWWVLIVICILGVVQTVMVIMAVTITLITHNLARIAEAKPYIITWFTTEIVVNLLNTSHLVYFFHTNQTGFQNTDALLKRLANVTTQSGLAVTVWSIIAMTACIIYNNGKGLLFVLSSPAFYLITFLSFLNSRRRRGHNVGIHHSENSNSGSPGDQVHPTSWCKIRFSTDISRTTRSGETTDDCNTVTGRRMSVSGSRMSGSVTHAHDGDSVDDRSTDRECSNRKKGADVRFAPNNHSGSSIITITP